MIFYFMDHGVYARLGETVKSHHADVRIICATTENPTSSLLNRSCTLAPAAFATSAVLSVQLSATTKISYSSSG